MDSKSARSTWRSAFDTSAVALAVEQLAAIKTGSRLQARVVKQHRLYPHIRVDGNDAFWIYDSTR